MSGLGEAYGAGEFSQAGISVQQKDIDQYLQYEVYAPSVDGAYIGTTSIVAAGTPAAMVFKSFTPDYPRNLKYTILGVAGGMGGTFNVSGYDQFGSAVSEQVGFATANGGGTGVGTQIFGSVTAATVTPVGLGNTAIGTSSLGFSTASGATGNWFGLPVKIGGTADIRSITWLANQVATPLNKGTNLGTLVSPGFGTKPSHAFQGTSGVANTDAYVAIIKTTFENLYKGTMTGL